MKFSLVIAFSLIVLVACSKDETSRTSPGEGYWILRNTQFVISKTEKLSQGKYSVLTGIENKNDDNRLELYFSTLPSVSGKYKVVPFREDVLLNSNEIGIRAKIPSVGTYSSTGISDNATWLPAEEASVFVNGGKITVTIPAMTMIIVTPTYNDTVSFEGNVQER